MSGMRTAAVALAIFGGIFALFGYAAVLSEKTGSEADLGYMWLIFTGLLVVVGGSLAARSRPEDASLSARACPNCGRQAQEGWAVCPLCGTSLPRSFREDYESENILMGQILFWIGIVLLDVLFVLLVLWLFRPSLAISHKIFLNMHGPLGIVLLDVGLGCMLLGYSFSPSIVRSQGQSRPPA